MNLDDNDFSLFGLKPAFALDASAVDQRWRELQAQVHPDRFAAEGAAAQRIAMQWAVRVNEAYRRLRDPLKRAAYLCELRGAPIEAENNTAMPLPFLQQQMVWREALDEADGEAATLALLDDVARHESIMLRLLQRHLDESQDARAAAALVRSLMFVKRFRQDVENRLEALAS